jgi:hypothetical protein
VSELRRAFSFLDCAKRSSPKTEGLGSLDCGIFWNYRVLGTPASGTALDPVNLTSMGGVFVNPPSW